MANTSKQLQIPLKERDVLRGLMAVKPTADMPRPGANPTGKKKGKKRAKPEH